MRVWRLKLLELSEEEMVLGGRFPGQVFLDHKVLLSDFEGGDQDGQIVIYSIENLIKFAIDIFKFRNRVDFELKTAHLPVKPDEKKFFVDSGVE